MLEELSQIVEGVKASTRWTCVMDKLCYFVGFIYPNIIRSFLLSIVWFWYYATYSYFTSCSSSQRYSCFILLEVFVYIIQVPCVVMGVQFGSLFMILEKRWSRLLGLPVMLRIFTYAREGTTTFCLLRFKLKEVKCFILVSYCIKPVYVLLVQYCTCWVFFTHSCV